jgi:putative nucleotidyltransferase with HDIG domain
VSSYLTVEQLQIGIYVQLDLPWVDHPFTFNGFKIKSPEQIEVLRQLGLERIRYDPARSSAKPLPQPALSALAPALPAAPVEDSPMMQAKRARIARLTEYREAVARAERALRSAARTVREINAYLVSHPKEVLPRAHAFVDELVAAFLAAPEATIHAMSGRTDTEELYQHGLNVALLCLIMAKAAGMAPDQARLLGMGALLHDIGLKEVPSRILRKTDPLTEAEYRLRQMHCRYGVEMGQRLGLPEAVLNIIGQHHETMDGGGYPDGLKGDRADPLARMVQVANRFDTLCNPVDAGQAMSPHAALSWMFAQQRAKHDPQALRLLIRCLGVYPPGTAVHLSNGATALVTSLNPDRPLRPMLVIYDPAVARNEAVILDLDAESEVNIASAIDPHELPRAIRDYLSMRQHVSYYFEEGAPGPV